MFHQCTCACMPAHTRMHAQRKQGLRENTKNWKDPWPTSQARSLPLQNSERERLWHFGECLHFHLLRFYFGSHRSICDSPICRAIQIRETLAAFLVYPRHQGHRGMFWDHSMVLLGTKAKGLFQSAALFGSRHLALAPLHCVVNSGWRFSSSCRSVCLLFFHQVCYAWGGGASCGSPTPHSMHA